MGRLAHPLDAELSGGGAGGTCLLDVELRGGLGGGPPRDLHSREVRAQLVEKPMHVHGKLPLHPSLQSHIYIYIYKGCWACIRGGTTVQLYEQSYCTGPVAGSRNPWG
eukprot:1178150-Prorocentrum_minimum.AAC.5